MKNKNLKNYESVIILKENLSEEEYHKEFDKIKDYMEGLVEFEKIEELGLKRLAYEVITFIHGEDAYNEALNISEALFSGNIKNLTSKEIEMAFKGLDKLIIDKDMNIVDFLVEYNICSSKRESREFVNNNSISINGEKINDLEFTINKDIAIDNKYVVVRRGKKKYFIVCFGGEDEEE